MTEEKSCFRLDSFEFKNWEICPVNGYLHANVSSTRTGVFKYYKPDGTIVRELRKPEEVFKLDSLKTSTGIPVTLYHPPEMVTPDNSHLYQVGTTHFDVNIPAEKDGEDLLLTDGLMNLKITVNSKKAIDAAIRGDAAQSSMGYYCQIKPGGGVWRGEPYDQEQVNIHNNHLALVKKGRAGDQCVIHFDSIDDIAFDEPIAVKMEKNIDPQLFNQIVTKLDSLQSEVTAETDRRSSAAIREFSGILTSLKEELASWRADSESSQLIEKDNRINQLEQELVANKSAMEEITANLAALKTQAETKLDSQGVTELALSLASEAGEMVKDAQAHGLEIKLDEALTAPRETRLKILSQLLPAGARLDVNWDENTLLGFYNGCMSALNASYNRMDASGSNRQLLESINNKVSVQMPEPTPSSNAIVASQRDKVFDLNARHNMPANFK